MRACTKLISVGGDKIVARAYYYRILRLKKKSYNITEKVSYRKVVEVVSLHGKEIIFKVR
jgi:hypothetical protein